MPTAHAVRHCLGLSRAACITLAAYFSACLGLQQHLPAGEQLLHTPFDRPVYLPLFALLLVLYACVCEWGHPRLLVRERRYWRGLGFFLAMALLYFTFFESFGGTKSLIPVLNPYHLDPMFQRAELMLHGGISPTQWMVNHAPAWLLEGLATLYFYAWGGIMMGYFIWQLCSPPSRARSQFLSSFVMLWVFAGIVFAVLFSSVGPLYYSLFYDDAFTAMNAEIVAKLYAPSSHLTQSLFLDVRQLLLDMRNEPTLTHVNGISAMPSLHTGVVMLIALHSMRHTRWLRLALVPFAFLIFLGSFALGWHYAIDTYASAIILAAIWHINRRELKMDEARVSLALL